jgi:hypothetical protein
MKQRGGRLQLLTLAQLVLVSAGLLYLAPTASRIPQVSVQWDTPVSVTEDDNKPDSDVHSFPDDDDPPPCGAFDSICYTQTAYGDNAH